MYLYSCVVIRVSLASLACYGHWHCKNTQNTYCALSIKYIQRLCTNMYNGFFSASSVEAKTTGVRCIPFEQNEFSHRKSEYSRNGITTGIIAISRLIHTRCAFFSSATFFLGQILEHESSQAVFVILPDADEYRKPSCEVLCIFNFSSKFPLGAQSLQCTIKVYVSRWWIHGFIPPETSCIDASGKCWFVVILMECMHIETQLPWLAIFLWASNAIYFKREREEKLAQRTIFD